ncbi:hypothetical protein IE53DRAFT_164403 [Violaceomyces palustris]|uniref:Uncharacterized protein n=1 Tax=Violaceomyces palustris TaxID=1673888 RepID=A0ACD0NTI6_9BASI|nr:hypothetical protein IE53DRAFT_164403 [Violaceomyces palustris]
MFNTQGGAPNTSVYPPQPYGGQQPQQQAFGTPMHTSSPSGPVAGSISAKTKPVGPHNGNLATRKRNASKSPEVEGKEKRSRPDDESGSPGNKLHPTSASNSTADVRTWGEEATKLDVYVWDYLSRRGFSGAAKALMSEAGMAEPPDVPLRTPQGLLFEYWAIFWDVFAARTGRGSGEASAYYEFQEGRQMQRIAEAGRRHEILEAGYHAPDNNGRFPSIVVSGQQGVPLEPGNIPVRPGPQQTWNPLALPPQQQQQLLIAAAQRQNIPLEELKNLAPASRIALLNSMNPANLASQAGSRPGQGNPQFDSQIQARLIQQQALHRQLQQQRAAGQNVNVGAPGQMGPMQVRPPVGPQGHPMQAGSPIAGQVGTPGGPDGGRRSVGPGQASQPDAGNLGGPRPDQAQQQGLPHGVSPQQQPQQTPQQHPPAGLPQHPQLNPQQQQAVISQYQSVQAAFKAEWMKAQNAPNPAMAQEFFATAQSYQAKAQSLQALLRAQANFSQHGQQQQQQQQQQGPQQPHPQQPPQRPPGSGVPMQMAGPGQGPMQHQMPGNLSSLTPQQRAAQIANAQAAAGRITPAMATHDPGLMTSMMGPGSMPNGISAPRAPTPQEGMQNLQGQHGQSNQQGQQGMAGPPPPQASMMGYDGSSGMNNAMDARARALQQQQQQQQQQHSQMHGMAASMGPFQPQQQQQNQPQQPQRPPSSQGRMEDPNQSHFAQVASSPAGSVPMQQPQPQRPGMNRTMSSQPPGGMGPPGPQHVSSPSPRIQANHIQGPPPQNTGSPAGGPVPSTPKLGGVEKGKKKEPKPRKNAKAATKTPTLSAASIPSGTQASGGGAQSASTPAAQPQTPASTSAPTPSMDRDVGVAAQTPSASKLTGETHGQHSAGQPQTQQNTGQGGPQNPSQGTTGQQTNHAMPPPSSAQPTGMTNVDGFSSGLDSSSGAVALGSGNSGAPGSSAAMSTDDFSQMFGVGNSMNDIFDFDFGTTDASGGGSGGLGGDGWDSNFGSLFGNADGMSGP